MADDRDEHDGVKVVATAIQPAAMLEQASLSKGPSLDNRFWGGISIIGGAVDLVASVPLWLAPEPTAATKFAAAAVDYVGADTLWTGMRQVWTGRQMKTFTADAVRRSLQSLGVDEDLADRLASGSDVAMNMAAAVAAPFAVAKATGATRILAVDRGLVDLDVEETWPGAHTLRQHVNRVTSQQLAMRFIEQPWLKSASNFSSKATAEWAISKSIAANADDIRAWASLAQPGDQEVWKALDCGQVIGQVLTKSTGVMIDATKVQIVLKKTVSSNKVWYIFTAYTVL